MHLDVYYDSTHVTVAIDPGSISDGEPFFARMDQDMDGGWRMGPEFVENPNTFERAQIAAARLLVALEQHNEALIRAMSGYIVSRIPECTAVRIDTEGDLQATEIICGAGTAGHAL